MTVLISGPISFCFYFCLPLKIWLLMNPPQDQNKYVALCPSCQCTQACSAGNYSLHNRNHDLLALIFLINVNAEMLDLYFTLALRLMGVHCLHITECVKVPLTLMLVEATCVV